MKRFFREAAIPLIVIASYGSYALLREPVSAMYARTQAQVSTWIEDRRDARMARIAEQERVEEERRAAEREARIVAQRAAEHLEQERAAAQAQAAEQQAALEAQRAAARDEAERARQEAEAAQRAAAQARAEQQAAEAEQQAALEAQRAAERARQEAEAAQQAAEAERADHEAALEAQRAAAQAARDEAEDARREAQVAQAAAQAAQAAAEAARSEADALREASARAEKEAHDAPPAATLPIDETLAEPEYEYDPVRTSVIARMIPLEPLVERIAREFRTDAKHVYAVLITESSLDPFAQNAHDDKHGLAQVRPSVLEAIGTSVTYAPSDNLERFAASLHWVSEHTGIDDFTTLASVHSRTGPLMTLDEYLSSPEHSGYLSLVENRIAYVEELMSACRRSDPDLDAICAASGTVAQRYAAIAQASRERAGKTSGLRMSIHEANAKMAHSAFLIERTR